MSVKGFKTLKEYLNAAIAKARFETIEKGARVYAEIPGFKGVWAEGKSHDQAKRELAQVLRGWIRLELERGRSLPEVDGMRPKELTFA